MAIQSTNTTGRASLDPASVPSYQNVAGRPDLVLKGTSPRLTVKETEYGVFLWWPETG